MPLGRAGPRNPFAQARLTLLHRASEPENVSDMERKEFVSGVKWESIVGYSRVVRVGPLVYVAGTTAWDDKGSLVGAGDPHAQAVQVIRNIERALESAGAGLKDVVRTRTFVTNIDDWKEVGRAHAEFFRDVRPVATMVEVKRLLDPRMLIEMEADAVIADAPLG